MKPSSDLRCLMVHNYFGHRRIPCEEYERDPLFFAKTQIEYLQRVKHNLDLIYFTVNWRGPEDDRLIDLLIQLLPPTIQSAKTQIMVRPNIGLSYGAFSDIYAKHRTEYGYYFFTEDDYLFTHNNFDDILIEMFHERSNTGYLCAIVREESDRYPKHAGLQMGVTMSTILEEVFKRNGKLSYNQESIYGLDYGKDEILGNIGQTNQIYQLGYDLVDIRERFTMYVVMPWPVNRYEHWFSENTEEIIVPIHRLLGKNFKVEKYASEMKPFIPKKLGTPKVINVSSAWGDIPSILLDIIDRFGIKRGRAIEFGVEFGYSTSALANYFSEVIGIDTFMGDTNAGFKGDIFDQTSLNLEGFPNIKLVKSSYQEFILENDEYYDLAHVDIVHTYEDTYACGEWAINHADVTIFHDTLSFPEVMQACTDLARKYGLLFYNYELSHGLGILVKQANSSRKSVH